MPYIRVKTGPNKGKVFEVKDAVITIGRDESQTIQVLDQGVSRAHAEVFRIGESCFVRDLNSTNGTFVNNTRVTEEVLRPQDELLIGTTILLFEDRLTVSDHGVEYDESEIREGTTSLKAVDGKEDARKSAEREVTSRHLTVTKDISRHLGLGRDLTQALRNAVETLAKSLQAAHGYLLMMDHATGKLTSRVSIQNEAEDGVDRKVSRTIVKHVLQNMAPVMTGDATLDNRFMLSESIVLKKIKSVLAAPIMIRDQVEGVLYFHASQASFAFKVQDLELVASVAMQLSMAIASHRYGEKVRRSLISTVRALVTAMEIVDPKNEGHSQRVADYSVALATEMGLPVEDVYKIRLSALLHDIGKLAMHHSSSGINREELESLHVTAAEKILTGIEGMEDILPGIRYHHERADGSGRPYKLVNDKLPVMARIIIVANHFDNLCSWGGPGGLGMAAREALEEIVRGTGKLYDEDVVRALQVCHQTGSLYASSRLVQD